jgi:dihydrofolate synthase/folylpolyglutamate synthase
MLSYPETLERIYNLHGGAIDLRLDRMRQALALFGHPENQFASIHVAGTNGKGSTSAMLHNILSLAGYRAALYTSPHLVSFTERIKVGDQEIAEREVVALADEIWQRTAAVGVSLTFFEIVTAMAFIYFARQKIDVAVVEVGLGGRLDATNVVTPLVSVITTISKDHEAFLGADLVSIGREKAGIIKPRVPVVCGELPAEVAQLTGQIAEERQTQAVFLGKDFKISLKMDGSFDYTSIKQHFSDLTVSLRGQHQKNNAAVALAALEASRGHFTVGDAAMRRGLATVRWPGRLEVMLDQPLVMIDGAHNGEGVRALAAELEKLRPGRRLKLLFAAMADKEWPLMLAALADRVDEVIFTKVAMERSADPAVMAEKFAGKLPARVVPDAQTALEGLLDDAAPRDAIIVAGSLYLLGEVRPLLVQRAQRAGRATP